jgi:Patatin-like phospholipase
VTTLLAPSAKSSQPQPAARRRGLVLAGGGLKAAYAAGVLEHLLPVLRHSKERPAFEFVEASSSGIWNAAMMAAGKAPNDIGDAWRRFRPLRAVSLNWPQLIQLFWGESYFTWDRFMRNIVRSERRGGWGLKLPLPADQAGCQYSFNAYNFTRHALVSFKPEQLDDDQFRACVALPRWFPPVRIQVPREKEDKDNQRDEQDQKDRNDKKDKNDKQDRTVEEVFVDAVFATDSDAAALLEHALDEIWVIWTVDVRGRWRNGWTANYFRLLEQAAASAYARERKQILDAGFTSAPEVKKGATPPGKILYEIAGDVPLHYVFALTGGGLRRAVRQGHANARAYLETHRHVWALPER